MSFNEITLARLEKTVCFRSEELPFYFIIIIILVCQCTLSARCQSVSLKAACGLSQKALCVYGTFAHVSLQTEERSRPAAGSAD